MSQNKTTPTTPKRIVSKSQYAKRQVKIALYTLGLVSLAPLCYAVTTQITYHLLLGRVAYGPLYFEVAIIGLPVCAIAAGVFALRKAQRIEPVVPLTRANTADLPAPDSLVRASEQPVQEQQAVLLRAASQNVPSPSIHLLRAGNAPEEDASDR